MKIAFLVCDHVSDEFVIDHGTYPDMFGLLLPQYQLDPFFICDFFFPDVDEYDVFICSGSKKSVYDKDPWIAHLLDLIVSINLRKKKFVGVCFGHQAVAKALGGRVEKSDLGYLIGAHTFSVRVHQPWMGDEYEFNMLMLCQDQVVELPENGVTIAESSDCPVGMYVIDNHIICIQGHPEFTKAYNHAVFQSRVDLIGEEGVKQAVKSLDQRVDMTLFSVWIKKFIDQGNN